MSDKPLYIRNCASVPIAQVPVYDIGSFYAVMQEELNASGQHLRVLRRFP